MLIDKDTQVCISIAKCAGNFGTRLHNKAFHKKGLNFLYKAFSVDDLQGAICAIRALGIRGAGVTMPYKTQVLEHIDELSESTKHTGAANTIVNNGGVLKAYNTDTFSSKILLKEAVQITGYDKLFILGRGGFSKAVEYSAKNISLFIDYIDRTNWAEISKIKEAIIFNCTPVSNIESLCHESVYFIDCLTNTGSGSRLAVLQASKQFKLYTGHDFPFSIVDDVLHE